MEHELNRFPVRADYITVTDGSISITGKIHRVRPHNVTTPDPNARTIEIVQDNGHSKTYHIHIDQTKGIKWAIIQPEPGQERQTKKIGKTSQSGQTGQPSQSGQPCQQSQYVQDPRAHTLPVQSPITPGQPQEPVEPSQPGQPGQPGPIQLVQPGQPEPPEPSQPLPLQPSQPPPLLGQSGPATPIQALQNTIFRTNFLETCVSHLTNQMNGFKQELQESRNDVIVLQKELVLTRRDVASLITANSKRSKSWIHGTHTPAELHSILTLPPAEQAKYYASGVASPKSKKAFCCKYRIVTNNAECRSRELLPELDKNGRYTRNMYVSGDATYMHLAHFGTKRIRELQFSQVYSNCKAYAFCAKCRDHYGNTSHFMNIWDRTNICGICKVSRCSRVVNASNSGIPHCGECSIFGDITKKMREKMLQVTLEVLVKIFPGLELETQMNLPVRTRSGNNRFIDYIMTGMWNGRKFVIIIEQDESQHIGYSRQDDRKKMIDQVLEMIGDKKDPNTPILTIRFNPNGPWNIANNNGTYTVVNKFDTLERLVILRQWIVWFLLNLDQMRSMQTWYFWYNASIKTSLFDHRYEGFAMINGGPKPKKVDWEWCPEPNEAHPNNGFRNVMQVDQVDPDDLCWRKDEETRQYPLAMAMDEKKP